LVECLARVSCAGGQTQIHRAEPKHNAALHLSMLMDRVHH
jgi:hypothetical protein